MVGRASRRLKRLIAVVRGLSPKQVEATAITVSFVGGLGLVAAGTALYSLGAGLIVAGAALVASTVLYVRGGRG